jgi:hypothetical protein
MSIFAGTGEKGVWRRALSDLFTLETNPDTLILDWDEANKGTIYIKTGVEWALQGFMPNWLTVDKTSGTGDDTLEFRSTKANLAAARRYAEFYLFSPKAATVSFTVSQMGRSEAVNENDELPIRVFPNPTSGLIQVSSIVPFQKIRILDPLGRLISETAEQGTEARINLTEKCRGVCYISVFMKNKIISRKVVLQ